MDIDLNSGPSTPESPSTPASSIGTICHSIYASPEHREHASEESTLNSPIYHESKINLVTSMLLIMSFVLKHNLTDAALQDLLKVIALQIPTPNISITSIYKFSHLLAWTIHAYTSAKSANQLLMAKCKANVNLAEIS